MKTILPQFQPDGSSLCGQTCIAMICGIHLADAVEAVGKGGGTTGPDLSRALCRRGIQSSPKMVRLGVQGRVLRKLFDFNVLPKRCIAKGRSSGVKNSHWVLIWDGEIHDPSRRYVPWGYVSGYIEIKEG